MRKRKLFDFTYIRHEHRRSYQLACILFSSILMCMGISNFLIGSVEVLGKSMLPHLQEGDRRLIHRWAYWIQTPERGDVVVIEDPETKGLSVKRIIGLPRDIVQLRSGMVFINGTPLTELYLSKRTLTWPSQTGIRDFIVPKDSFFLLGDNRPDSADSRVYGAVHEAGIVGKLGQ